MVTRVREISITEFDEFVMHPENADRMFEFIGGEIVEVVSNNYSSYIAAVILAAAMTFVRKNMLDYVTGADGGHIISGEKYIPDIAFISRTKQPEPSHAAYNPNPPDLAVEVLSPTNDDDRMRIKTSNYLATDVVVWVVDPEKHLVEVHQSGQRVQILRENDTLDNGTLLSGFQLSVTDIFNDVLQIPTDDGNPDLAID